MTSTTTTTTTTTTPTVNERTALLHCHIVQMPKNIDDYEPILDVNEDCGLTYEELMPFVNDPFWRHLRRVMFSTFWLILIFAIIVACFLAYAERDKCTILNGNLMMRTNEIIETTMANNLMMNRATTLLMGGSSKLLP